MNNLNNAKDLSILICSKIPLIIIESNEEQRVLAMIWHLSQKLRLPLYNWTVTSGLILQNSDTMVEIFNQDLLKPEHVFAKIKSYKESSLFVLCDFHPYLVDAPHIVRLIKEIALGYRYMGHTIIFLSHRLELPDEIKPFSARFEIPMPDANMLKKIIYEEAVRYKKAFQKHVKSNPRIIKKMIRNLMGLTLSDARRLARKTIYDDGLITESDLPEVRKAKYELLNLDGLVSFEYETSSFSEVGGLENLKRWLKNREKAFLGDGLGNGLDLPKGIMLLGVQGCGKSLAAKAVAGVWGLPLLRLDFAILYNKFFGETERNLRKALKMAEVMAPCVLWIDEIEKGIAAGGYDSGTSRRVLGSMLTWMSERRKAVFIVATSNDIASLPPELIRKGRLDEIFFVDLPDKDVRQKIFRIHLTKRDLNPDDFDLFHLAIASEGFSGAEIEQVVVSGLYQSLALTKPLSSEDMLKEISRTSPISTVMAEDVASLRRWAKGRTVSAN